MRKIFAISGAGLILAGTAALAASATAAPNKADVAAVEPHLVAMPQISVPIIDGDRLEGSFRLTMVLAATDAKAAERVSAVLPRLRSTSVAEALEFSRLHASPMRPVDVELLSRDLTKALQQEEPGIARALVVEVATGPA